MENEIKLEDLETYDKIPKELQPKIDEFYNDVLKTKVYETTYEILCFLEDFYQSLIDDSIRDDTFSYEDELSKKYILLRTFSKMLAMDCLGVERANNWDEWVDKIKDTPKITEDDVKNLRSLDFDQIIDLFK